MNEFQLHREFLEAIAENPDDDMPRHVYADWLTEQGDPLGELILLEMELYRAVMAARPRETFQEGEPVHDYAVMFAEIKRGIEREILYPTKWNRIIGFIFPSYSRIKIKESETTP